MSYLVGNTFNLKSILNENEAIIDLLDSNREYSQLDSYESGAMQNQINDFEGILKPLTFVDTINIANIPGSYLFSKGLLYEDFNVNNREWFT